MTFEGLRDTFGTSKIVGGVHLGGFIFPREDTRNGLAINKVRALRLYQLVAWSTYVLFLGTAVVSDR